MLVRVFALGLLLTALAITTTCNAKRTLSPHGRVHALPTVAPGNSIPVVLPHPTNSTTTTKHAVVHFGHRRNFTTTTTKAVGNTTELPQTHSMDGALISLNATEMVVAEKVNPENITAVPVPEVSAITAVTKIVETTTSKHDLTENPTGVHDNITAVPTPTSPAINLQSENGLGSTVPSETGVTELPASGPKLTDAEASTQSTISAVASSTAEITSEATNLATQSTPTVGNNAVHTEAPNNATVMTEIRPETTGEPTATTAAATPTQEPHSSAQNISSLNPQPISPSIIGEKRIKRQLTGFPGSGQLGQGMFGNIGGMPTGNIPFAGNVMGSSGIQGGGAFGGSPTIVDTVQVEDIISPGVVPGVVGGLGGMPTIVDTITEEDIVAPGLG